MPIAALFLPKTHFGAGIPDLDAVRILSYLALLAFLAEMALNRLRAKWNAWLSIILLFSIFVVLSVSWSHNYTYSLSTIQGLFSTIALPFLLSFMSVNLFYSKQAIDRFVKHISAAGCVLAFVSIVQFTYKLSVVHGELRSVGTLGNPNALAIFLVLILPCIMYGAESNVFRRPIGWIILIIVFIGILCTVSRKGTITAVLSFILYSFLKKNWKLLFLTICLSVLCTTMISANKTMVQRFGKEKFQHDIEGKFAMARAGIDMFKKQPLLGLGYQGYYENFGKYFPLSHKRKYDAHNEYVTALANYGALGFIFFVSIFVYPICVAKRLLRKTGYRRDMAILGLSVVIPYMVNIGFAGTAFYQPVLTCLYYTQTSFIFVNENREINV